MKTTLRPTTQDDLVAVQEIVRQAYTHYVARIGHEPGPMLDDYAALIAEDWAHVAECDSVVRGLLVLIP